MDGLAGIHHTRRALPCQPASCARLGDVGSCGARHRRHLPDATPGGRQPGKPQMCGGLAQLASWPVERSGSVATKRGPPGLGRTLPDRNPEPGDASRGGLLGLPSSWPGMGHVGHRLARALPRALSHGARRGARDAAVRLEGVDYVARARDAPGGLRLSSAACGRLLERAWAVGGHVRMEGERTGEWLEERGREVRSGARDVPWRSSVACTLARTEIEPRESSSQRRAPLQPPAVLWLEELVRCRRQ